MFVCSMMLAVAPLLIVPVVIGVVCVVCLIGWGLWRAFQKEHHYLLTGFSGSGKTELHIALADLVKSGKHEHHSEESTPNAYEEIKIAAKHFMVFKDGGGSVEHSELRKPTYLKFFKEAQSAWVDRYTVLFLVDLSTFQDANHRRFVKSELIFLNGLVKDFFEDRKPNADKRFKMVVVGTHADVVDDPGRALNELAGNTGKWIATDYFNVRYLKADLYHCETVKEFAKQLFDAESKEG